MIFYRIIMVIVVSFNLVISSGNTGLSFLKIGIDARAIGMGEAFCAATNDASSVYWNPAGLVNAKYSNVSFNHTEWIEGIRGEFASLSFNRERSALALHVRSFNIGDIEVRSFPTENPLEKTNANYLSAGISYSHQIKSKLAVGVTAKYLFEKIYIESASGFAVDVGLVYRDLIPNLMLGISVQNFGKMNRFLNESSELSKITRIGAFYMLPLAKKNVQINLASDIVQFSQEKIRYHFGSELIFFKQLVVRGGYMVGYESRENSFGMGILRSSIRLDYAITPFNNDIGVAHRFSVNFNL